MAGEARDKRTAVLPLLLGFNGGYVDTMGFLALQGLFTAPVTGNFSARRAPWRSCWLCRSFAQLSSSAGCCRTRSDTGRPRCFVTC